jgi:glycosyltransferase involved in cell wall biosynthesis
VWASDIHKAHIAQEIGRLSSTPMICHNCPPISYLPNSVWPRDNWLRTELRRAGAKIENGGGSILLRAGAIGEYGGIEETLEGMKGLPEDYIFLMIGRPPAEYKQKILTYISTLDLGNRAFLWDRPSDDVWKSALRGADIGHLIHGPFPPGRMTRLYNLNSSLSNNRLFQYMAASLPIIAYDDPRMESIYKEVPCFRVARLSNLVKDIHRAWRELGGDDTRRKSLGEAGRKAHLQKYCWEVQFSPVFDAINV